MRGGKKKGTSEDLFDLYVWLMVENSFKKMSTETKKTFEKMEKKQ